MEPIISPVGNFKIRKKTRSGRSEISDFGAVFPRLSKEGRNIFKAGPDRRGFIINQVVVSIRLS